MPKNIIHNSLKNQPNEKGRFGIYGGMFVAETLMPLITSVTSAYNKIKDSNSFNKKSSVIVLPKTRKKVFDQKKSEAKI